MCNERPAVSSGRERIAGREGYNCTGVGYRTRFSRAKLEGSIAEKLAFPFSAACLPIHCHSLNHPIMLPTRALLGQARLTLFTRAGCGLCDTAKHTVLQLNKRRPFDYVEKDIMDAGNKEWRDVYDFDVPVLHVQSVKDGLPKEADLSDTRKLFHRWTEQEVEQLVDEAEK